MQPYTTRAVLVRQVETGEADRVVTLLTEAQGRVSAIAKGAQRSRKRFGGALAYYVLAEAELRPRRGSGLGVLTRYEALETFPGIATRLGAIVHASYVTEAVAALSPESHPEPEFLQILLETYRFLSAHGPALGVLRLQEFRLLEAAGLAPQLDGCVACGRTVSIDEEVGFDPARGGVLCDGCTGAEAKLDARSLQALSRLRQIARQAPVDLEAAAEELSLSAAVHTDLRRALTGSVVHAVGRPLKSLEFLRQVTR